MTRIVFLSSSVAAAVCCAELSIAQASKELSNVWALTDGVQAPESTYLEPKSGALFVSQIGAGGGKGKDGDGWISKLTTDGRVVKAKWATGLNAPKGLRSHGGTLWVTDIDRFVSFALDSGKQTAEIKVPGAEFLNDLACGADGTVYVSDMTAGKIYQYKDGKLSVFAEGDEIEHPNGLLVHGGKLIAGGWGMDIQGDFSTKKLGRLLAIDLKTKKVTPITDEPTGNLDGVESDGAGGFVVSDWIAGKVFHIGAKGKTKVVATFPKGAADIAYLPDKKLLILPEMLENKIGAFDLSSSF